MRNKQVTVERRNPMSAATAPIAGRHVIAGRALSDAAQSFESHDPSRWEQIVGTFPKGTAKEATAAVQAARDAYPMWRRTSRILRAEMFNKLGQLIERDVDQLANLMARECGKVVTECRAEVIEGLHMVQYVFGTGRMPTGQVLASEIAEKD